jgi:hypothetical protein
MIAPTVRAEEGAPSGARATDRRAERIFSITTFADLGLGPDVPILDLAPTF